MNYALEELRTYLRRLQNTGVNQYDRETICQILGAVNQIVDNLDEEYRKMYTIMNFMDSNRTFGSCMYSVQGIIMNKKQEMSQWEEIQTLLRRLMN